MRTASPKLARAAAALIGGLVLTGIVAALMRKSLVPRAASWPRLFGYAVLYVSVAGVANGLAIWSVCRTLRAKIEVGARTLIFGLWTSAVWLPLLMVLIQEGSAWTAAIAPLIAVQAAIFLRHWRANEEAGAGVRFDGRDALSLFRRPEPPSLVRTLLPAAVASLAFQMGGGALVHGSDLMAGLLFSVSATIAVWIMPAGTGAGAEQGGGEIPLRYRSLVANSLAAILLTAIALAPFLPNGGAEGALAALFGRGSGVAPRSRSSGRPKVSAPNNSYSSVILLAPPRAPQKVVPPPPKSFLLAGGVRTRAVVIPFDGAYWYFKPPDRHPKVDARVVHGDPTKENIRSTDWTPLSMEAHQRIAPSIRMDCCSAMSVSILNADNRRGAVSVEVLLRDTVSVTPSAQSLGSAVLRSSEEQTISADRIPVDETLSFPFPAVARGRNFDEITVVIRSGYGRALAGAHIAIQQFELVP